MNGINPLLTANNPAPIPGCHAAVKAIAHSDVVLSLMVVYYHVLNPKKTLTNLRPHDFLPNESK
jgi:hypothetical protein